MGMSLFIGIVAVLVLVMVLAIAWPSSGVGAPSSAPAQYTGPTIDLKKTHGGFIEAVGEASYLDALRMLKQRYGAEFTTALLIPEPTNEYDPNAIEIRIDNYRVGYLSKGDAKKFRKTHRAGLAEGLPFRVWARMAGGERGKENIGVYLDFDIDEESRYKREMKTGSTAAAVLLMLMLAGCTPILLAGHPKYMRTDDLAQLPPEDLLARYHYMRGGCDRASRPHLNGMCLRWSKPEEWTSVGARLAEVHPEWSDALKTALREGWYARPGMTFKEVEILMGEPEDINSTETLYGRREQWVYANQTYVYIERGIVTAVQL